VNPAISVLIVEDDPLIAEAHRTYLERLEGFSATAVAHTARDAMQAAAAAAAAGTPVELVLLDLGLPDASGINLASALAGLRPAPDIIAITSERDLEMVRAAVAHGALAYLLKPFTFAAFRDGWSAIGATGSPCPPASTRPARPRSTATPSPNYVRPQTSPAPKGAAPQTTMTSPALCETKPTGLCRRRSGRSRSGVPSDGVALPGATGRRRHRQP
jgi:DNA-binding NarL/FixJ family response regulator